MRKQELRKLYKNKRESLTKVQIDDYSIAVANQLLQFKDLWDFQFFHIFLSIEHQKEINTEFILSILQGKDKNVVISKSDFRTNELTNYLLTDATVIKVNSYGIPEPIDGIQINNKQIEVVFIPLLAYDFKGNRIGYGKGFYDRFLSQCKPETLKIGLSFYGPEKDLIEDTHPNDIPLDHCITPEEIISF